MPKVFKITIGLLLSFVAAFTIAIVGYTRVLPFIVDIFQINCGLGCRPGFISMDLYYIFIMTVVLTILFYIPMRKLLKI